MTRTDEDARLRAGRQENPASCRLSFQLTAGMRRNTVAAASHARTRVLTQEIGAVDLPGETVTYYRLTVLPLGVSIRP
jgi:hypothetical protein